MKNKVTKNLIILGIIVLSFIFTNNAQAYCQRYAFSNKLVDPNCIEESTYYSNSQTSSSTSSNTSSNSQTATPDTNVVNNYYYYPTTSKTTTSNTSTTKSTVDTSKDTSNNNSNYNSGTSDYHNVYSNDLGASAYNSGQSSNGITALSLKGSGSFMPSSIWQWIMVIILILAIIVIARMFVRKPSPADHDIHIAHAH